MIKDIRQLSVYDQNSILKKRLERYESEGVAAVMKEHYEKELQAAKYRRDQADKFWHNCLDENKRLKRRNRDLYRDNQRLQKEKRAAEKKSEKDQRLRKMAEDELEKWKEKYAGQATKEDELLEKIEERNKQIEVLKDEIARQQAIIDNDGTTSGLPTGRTPFGKKKVIPNSREKSGKKRGGQPGHKKKTLPPVPDDEVDDITIHMAEKCPDCGGPVIKTGQDESHDVSDYEVKIIHHRHVFKGCRCLICGREFHESVPEKLTAEHGYGAAIQAMALALINLGFVSVKRSRELIIGLMGNKIRPSEGYIFKLTRRAARKLKKFVSDVKDACVRQKILYWDDTVIFINTKRGCMRFYGNERVAFYTAHEKKDAAGIEADGILVRLTSFTSLMHDHVKYNYRKEFLFRNLECIAHLQRELQKLYNDSGHKWALDLKELIGEMVGRRKRIKAAGGSEFEKGETQRFEEKLREYVNEGIKVYEADGNRYYHNDEKNAIAKLEEYKENYFGWVYNFELPTTNNESERSLRMTKSKQKISGQFGDVKSAEDFAAVRTYIETCRRNGKEPYDALYRLMDDDPYTVEELLTSA